MKHRKILTEGKETRKNEQEEKKQENMRRREGNRKI